MPGSASGASADDRPPSSDVSAAGTLPQDIAFTVTITPARAVTLNLNYAQDPGLQPGTAGDFVTTNATGIGNFTVTVPSGVVKWPVGHDHGSYGTAAPRQATVTIGTVGRVIRERTGAAPSAAPFSVRSRHRRPASPPQPSTATGEGLPAPGAVPRRGGTPAGAAEVAWGRARYNDEMAEASRRIEELRRELAANPGSRQFYQLGELLRRDAHPAEAAGVLRSGLAHHPRYVAAWVSLGRACIESGESTEAVSGLREALALDPGNPVAWRLLGEAYLALGQRPRALEAMTRCLELVPGDEVLQSAVDALSGDEPGPEAAPAVAAPAGPRPAPARRRPPRSLSGRLRRRRTRRRNPGPRPRKRRRPRRSPRPPRSRSAAVPPRPRARKPRLKRPPRCCRRTSSRRWRRWWGSSSSPRRRPRRSRRRPWPPRRRPRRPPSSRPRRRRRSRRRSRRRPAPASRSRPPRRSWPSRPRPGPRSRPPPRSPTRGSPRPTKPPAGRDADLFTAPETDQAPALLKAVLQASAAQAADRAGPAARLADAGAAVRAAAGARRGRCAVLERLLEREPANVEARDLLALVRDMMAPLPGGAAAGSPPRERKIAALQRWLASLTLGQERADAMTFAEAPCRGRGVRRRHRSRRSPTATASRSRAGASATEESRS